MFVKGFLKPELFNFSVKYKISNVFVRFKKSSHNDLSNPRKHSNIVDSESNEILKKIKTFDSSFFKPAIPIQSFYLAAYVNNSNTLQNLVNLGVDLHKIEKNADLASFLAKADFKKNIQPLILFLHHNNIPSDQLGIIFTKNISIFKEPLEKLQLRINYLKSKKFSNKAISRIICKNPHVITMSTIFTDQQLGLLQMKLDLTGSVQFIKGFQFSTIIHWLKKLSK